jgi:hypothetical protein
MGVATYEPMGSKRKSIYKPSYDVNKSDCVGLMVIMWKN